MSLDSGFGLNLDMDVSLPGEQQQMFRSWCFCQLGRGQV